MSKTYRCVIWGMGEDYEKRLNQVLFEIEKKNIEVIAIVVQEKDRYCKYKDGFQIVVKEELLSYEFDYLIIHSNRFQKDIRREGEMLGITNEKIIDGKVFELPLFDFSRYVKLLENPVTILSDDCWGGYVYHMLCLPFTSPLINTFFARGEYAKFLQDPLFYLGTELKMVRDGCFERSEWPIGRMGDEENCVLVEFHHAVTFAEAKNEWDRRLKRINPQNIFVKNGFSQAEKGHELWLESFRKVLYPKILLYYGETDIREAFRTECLFTQYRNSGFVSNFNYNAMVREAMKRAMIMDILKLLTGEGDYIREIY